MWRVTKSKANFKNLSRLSDYPRSREDFKKLQSKDLNKVKDRIEKFDQSAEVYWEGQKVVVLHYAAAKLDLDQLRVILPKIQDVNQKSDKGWNGLHFAVSYCNKVEVIAELCNRGVDADLHENEDGHTPIMFAIVNQNLAAVKILWEFSNTNSRDNKGNNAIELARVTNKPQIVRYLEKQQRADETDDRIHRVAQIQEGLQATVHQHGKQLIEHQQIFEDCGKRLSMVESDLVDWKRQLLRQNSCCSSKASRYGSSDTLNSFDTGIYSNGGESCSEFSYREAGNLRAIYDVLCAQMRPSEMISKLFAYNTVSFNFKQRLDTFVSDEMKNSEILDQIMKGPRSYYDNFIKVLRQTNQQHIVDMIEKRASACLSEYDNAESQSIYL